MNIENIEEKSAFLIEAMQSFNASLEISVVVEKMFLFLEKYFPIEGLSLHQILPEKSRVKAYFFMTDEGLQEQVDYYTLNKKELDNLIEAEKDIGTSYFEYETIIARKFVHELFVVHLKNKKPNVLVSHLAIDEFIGHFALFSKEGEEFTKEHIVLLDLLSDILTSAMINIYHYTELKKNQEILQEENIHLKLKIEESPELISNSPNIKKVLEMVDVLAAKDVQVLILGETGTGKELIANTLQENSSRNNKIFLKVNCGAIPESLIDSELFGYEKGAFTGAYGTKKGYFEQADGGTLFLDEVGELSLQAQVRLLRVLQFGLIERVGGKEAIPVNVRIIAATNRNLENMLHMGTFREDLYYRLHAFPIHIPPLRKRREDIPLLLNFFIKKYAPAHRKNGVEIDQTTFPLLLSYSWPGNVRELENNVERCIVLSSSDCVDFAEHLPKNPNWYQENIEALDKYEYKKPEITENTNTNDAFIIEVAREVAKILSIENKAQIPIAQAYKSLDEIKKEQILQALKSSNGKICGKNSAAEILNLKCGTLRKRMEKLGISSKKLKEECI